MPAWTRAVSSTGHGSFRAASLPGNYRRGTTPPTCSPPSVARRHTPPGLDPHGTSRALHGRDRVLVVVVPLLGNFLRGPAGGERHFPAPRATTKTVPSPWSIGSSGTSLASFHVIGPGQRTGGAPGEDARRGHGAGLLRGAWQRCSRVHGPLNSCNGFGVRGLQEVPIPVDATFRGREDEDGRVLGPGSAAGTAVPDQA